MNFRNVKVPNVLGGGAASALLKVGAVAAFSVKKEEQNIKRLAQTQYKSASIVLYECLLLC